MFPADRTYARIAVAWLVAVALSVVVFPLDAAAEPAAEAPTTVERTPVLEDPAFARLDAIWREVQADVSRQAWEEAAGRLRHLMDVRLELGVPNMPQVSAVLLHAADEAARGGAVDSAQALAEAAALISPDLSGARFEKVRYIFDQNAFAVAEQIKELRNGFERLDTDLPAGVTFIGDTLTAWTYVLVVLGVLFALAMVVRYRQFSANDLRRRLPAGVTRLQADVLLVVLLLAPFLAGAGIMLTTVLWLVATSLYHRATERVATVVLLIGVGALPYATQYVVRTLTYASTPEAAIHRCNAGLCSADDSEAIQSWANTNVLPYESNFTMGLVLMRHGAGSGHGLDRATQYATVANDERPTAEAYTLLGNLAYLEALRTCREVDAKKPGAITRLEKKQREAVDWYQQALAKAPEYLPALYNSNAALRQLDDHKAAEPMLERAMRLDTARVLYWNKEVSEENNLVRCRMVASGNKHLMHPRLPSGHLRSIAMSRPVPNDALVIPFGGLVTGRFGTRGTELAGIGGAALVIILWLLTAVIRPSRPCTECGEVADPRTRLDIEQGAICERCLLIDIRRAFVDAKEQWFREKERELAMSGRARRARLVTWFLPGFGHLLRGAALRGLLFLGLITGCVVSGLALHSVVTDPQVPIGVSAGRLFIYGVIAASVWLIAVLDAHTGRTVSS